MKRKLWLTVFVFCFIMLLPHAVSATEVDGVNPDEVASADYGRVVTEEEFKLISDTLIAQQKENPNVTAEEVIEQLGLQDVKVVHEEDFDEEKKDLKREISTMAVDEPHVGFADAVRTSTQAGAYATAVVIQPTHAVDKYQASIFGYSQLPGTSPAYSYVITAQQENINAFLLQPGITRLGSKMFVTHYNRPAKIRVNAVITDGGPQTYRYAILEWDVNGRYTIYTSN